MCWFIGGVFYALSWIVICYILVMAAIGVTNLMLWRTGPSQPMTVTCIQGQC
jgi:hypothetical protein